MVQDMGDKTSPTLCAHANVGSELLPMTHIRAHWLEILMFVLNIYNKTKSKDLFSISYVY